MAENFRLPTRRAARFRRAVVSPAGARRAGADRRQRQRQDEPAAPARQLDCAGGRRGSLGESRSRRISRPIAPAALCRPSGRCQAGVDPARNLGFWAALRGRGRAGGRRVDAALAPLPLTWWRIGRADGCRRASAGGWHSLGLSATKAPVWLLDEPTSGARRGQSNPPRAGYRRASRKRADVSWSRAIRAIDIGAAAASRSMPSRPRPS